MFSNPPKNIDYFLVHNCISSQCNVINHNITTIFIVSVPAFFLADRSLMILSNKLVFFQAGCVLPDLNSCFQGALFLWAFHVKTVVLLRSTLLFRQNMKDKCTYAHAYTYMHMMHLHKLPCNFQQDLGLLDAKVENSWSKFCMT